LRLKPGENLNTFHKNINKPASLLVNLNTEIKTMYADPRLIKKHEVKVRLDDDVNALVDALVKNTGGQKAVIVRDIFLRGLGVVSNIKSADITHA
jgi:hypothetical protein